MKLPYINKTKLHVYNRGFNSVKFPSIIKSQLAEGSKSRVNHCISVFGYFIPPE